MAERKKRGESPPGKGSPDKEVQATPGKKPAAVYKKYKTYEELMEMEETKKRHEAEQDAEEAARREARARFFAWTKYVPTPKRVYKWAFPFDFVKKANLKLGDAMGKMEASFKLLHVKGKKERRDWFKLWCEMDKTMSNRVTYTVFARYFNMPDDMWSRRMYELANENLNGSLSFTEFLSFCCKYLYIDRHLTEEFSFRMISRRGSTFKPKLSVLDLEDMKQFVRFRFKMKEPKEIHKRGLDVLNYVDTDGDGSLYLDEYELFTKRNPCFVRFTHLWQQHMRKCIFGFKYWVTKSRHIKSDNAKGLENATLFHRINLASENFCRIELENPVVDERGRIIVVTPYISPRVFDVDDVAPPPTAPLGAISSGTRPIGSPSATAASSTKQISANPVATAAVASIPILSAVPPSPPSRLPPVKLSSGPEIPPGKSMLAWHGPLQASVNICLAKPFEQEFAEVHIIKLEKRAKRKERRVKDSILAKAVAAHTYKRLVKVCEDLIYGRKWLRLAFDHWVDTVGMEKVETAAAMQSAEEQRLVARKRMAKLITKENVKDVSLRDVSEENLNKLAATEKATKEAAMFGPKGGLEQVAAKLEEQGVMVDDMHSRIVDNCRKQEEQMDDPDEQCASYVRGVFMRQHLRFMQAYRHDRLLKFSADQMEFAPTEETRKELRQKVLPPAHNYKKRLNYDAGRDPTSYSDTEGEGEGEYF